MSEAPRAGGDGAGATRRVLLAQAYGFCLMASYGLLKPLREDMGKQCGARNLEWLWLGTLIVSVALLPPYWRLVASLSRRTLIAWVNRAVALSLVVFYALFRGEHLTRFKLNDLAWFDATFRDVGWLHGGFLSLPLLPLALYVWVSVFNLLVLSLFWSVMADRHDASEGKRLFGPIAIGITVGAITGSSLVLAFSEALKTSGLLLVAAGLLEVATWAGRRVAGDDLAPQAMAKRGGVVEALRRWLVGFAAVGTSPYLAALIGYQFLSIAASTVLYSQRTELMETSGLANSKAFFAWNDLATQTLALLVQAFVAARLMRRWGVGWALTVQMVLAIAGFVALGFAVDLPGGIAADAGWRRLLLLPEGALPAGLAAVLFFFVVQKGVEYGLSKPTREALFTVVTREEKYQAKSLIDTGLYRAFDQVTMVSYSRMHYSKPGFSLPLATCAFAMAPVMGAGILLAWWLGREHARRVDEATKAAASPPADRDPLPKA